MSAFNGMGQWMDESVDDGYGKAWSYRAFSVLDTEPDAPQTGPSPSDGSPRRPGAQASARLSAARGRRQAARFASRTGMMLRSPEP
jgi:hypothetical protein